MLYEIKYWWGVNFGNWWYFDKIAKSWSTIILNTYILFLPCHIAIAKWHYCSILRELTNPKFPYHQSWIHYQIKCYFQEVSKLIQKNVIDEVTTSKTSKKQWHMMSKNAALNHVCFPRNFHTCMPLCHLVNMHTLKLTLSCNYMCIYEIV